MIRPSALAWTILLAPAAQARPEAPLTTIPATEVVRLLTEVDHGPELRTDSGGDPLVVATVNGTRYSVLFYGCTAHRTCTSIQFRAYYDLSRAIPLDRINEWNRTSLLGRAYLDKDEDPTIEHTVRLAGGVTYAHLQAERDWFLLAIRDFEALVSEFQEPAPVAP